MNSQVFKRTGISQCYAGWSSSAIYVGSKCGSATPGSTGKLIHPVAKRQAGGRSSIDCVLVDAIVGKTPIISCEIAGEKNSMVLDMGSEVTILQEWWFNEYLMASVDCLEDRSSWLRLEAADSLVFPYIWYFTADINVLGTIVKNKGIPVQKDPPGLNHNRQTSGILGMNVLGAIP